jgi:RNA polymerase sigma-70 factor (ECF subfamily)
VNSLNPDERSDQELVAELNAGDASAFDALYFRYRDWVVRLAQRLTGNSDDALDVLQETFGYVFGKFPGFVLTARMTTFLYPVVKNISIAHRRKRLRIGGNDVPVDAVAMPVEWASDPKAELAIVLGKLPEAQREVLLMRFVDDMSLAEIGAALGVPEGTVKSRVHNAIAVLREDPQVKKYFDR